MGQVLHGSATTTEAVRRAIQLRQESVRALAKRYGVSPTTVQKWRKRSTTADAPMGPKEPRSTVLPRFRWLPTGRPPTEGEQPRPATAAATSTEPSRAHGDRRTARPRP